MPRSEGGFYCEGSDMSALRHKDNSQIIALLYLKLRWVTIKMSVAK